VRRTGAAVGAARGTAPDIDATNLSTRGGGGGAALVVSVAFIVARVKRRGGGSAAGTDEDAVVAVDLVGRTGVALVTVRDVLAPRPLPLPEEPGLATGTAESFLAKAFETQLILNRYGTQRF